MIGGGAYGEVWLARGVTGALRAVKVVSREDFDDERTFEREFEGIKKFEPISRDHPGLVNILHVGRSADGKAFYYYVMELGDDVRSGRDINAIEYEPRTLRADNKMAAGKPMPTEECIEVGIALAEALQYLHDLGLAHRDVKPSNVIFVGGKAKLADIGLVAPRGQRTFVGTEGFVPPEGPGSSQADVYSLGKVLYEITTGKDRLDFPELPDDVTPDSNPKQWLALNHVICDTCEPALSRRKIKTAADLAEALRRLQRGKRPQRVRYGAWITMLLLGSVVAYGAWSLVKSLPQSQQIVSGPVVPPVPKMGKIRVISAPENAEVFDEEGSRVGVTPYDAEALVGTTATFTISKMGFRPVLVHAVVEESSIHDRQLIEGNLQFFDPPAPGQVWNDQLGQGYQPEGGAHVATNWVLFVEWRKFCQSTKRNFDEKYVVQRPIQGQPRQVVLATPEEAQAFSDWLLKNGIKDGYLTEDHQVVPLMEESFDTNGVPPELLEGGRRPFRCKVSLIPYATVTVTTEPAGAEVYFNGESHGVASEPLKIEKVKPGTAKFLILLEGYKPKTLDVAMGPGEHRDVHVALEENQGVVFGKKWTNGLGLQMVPIGPDLMASVWETRVSDWNAYAKDVKRAALPNPDFKQDGNHPVVFVSRKDAEEFCDWLTQRERKQERITLSHVYRLPTDEEWSRMAGMARDPGETPSERDSNKELIFAWGTAWPPPSSPLVGNLADQSAAKASGISPDMTIEGYNDGYENTAPVGKFPPNEVGLYDMCGNVQEWVSDSYNKKGRHGVLRGGGWSTGLKENLYLGTRNAVPPNFRDNIYGFRVVLAKVPPKRENEPNSNG